MEAETARGRATLLKQAIFENDRLLELAGRPLLLTLMASLHAWREGSLPEDRAELYDATVDLLLEIWEKRRLEPNIQPSLAEYLKVGREKIRGLLGELAYQVHKSQSESKEGTADIDEGALVSGLMRLNPDFEVNPARLVEYLSHRAGLLVSRGVGVYSFPHRTFQEYLAACHLVDSDFLYELAQWARQDPNRWREVALLAGAKAGGLGAILSFVDDLCPRPESDSENGEAEAWGALLAGQILVETVDLNRIRNQKRHILERVQAGQVDILSKGQLPARERVAAGRTLAHLGDPRPGVGLRNDGLPDIIWCQVPAGPFLMGSDPKRDPQAYDNEKPQHKVDLRAYKIGRYLVTNAQYAAFVEDGGYTDKWEQCWTKAGWKWKGKRTGPSRYGSNFDLPNHPVVGVTWYEAVAFCNWLTFQLGQAIRLPTEAEWEKAARGADGRLYPWGDEPDPNRANYSDTGIGSTSAVGCFPSGVSPYGVHDMAGNVWEWTLSDYKKYPYQADDRQEDRSRTNVLKVLRGGSWNNLGNNVRAAIRSYIEPDNRDNIQRV
jgi:formylglycine-generating enzyme required for sulfatase activity